MHRIISLYCFLLNIKHRTNSYILNLYPELHNTIPQMLLKWDFPVLLVELICFTIQKVD